MSASAVPTRPASAARGRPGHGLVLGKFYPPHAGHHHLIDKALDGCERLTVLVAGATVESIPLAVRHRWIAERHPQARVVSVNDDIPIDMNDPQIWDAHMELWRSAIDEPVDVVFSSETYGAELARRFGAAEVLVDLARGAYPVSGTTVRANPPAYWEMLEPAVRAWLTKRIVVLGAESTGTTTLSAALAEHYDTCWVPEYGRTMSELKMAAGTFDEWSDLDFLAIYLRQSQREEQAARQAGPVMIADTDPLATLVWEERYRGSASDEGQHLVALRRPPALYLLTDHVGVAFEDDGLRDGEHLRHWMTERFEQVLAAQPAPWLKVTGSHSQRLTQATAAIDQVLADGWHFAAPLG